MRKEITEDQITNLMQAIPRAEEVDRLRAEIEWLLGTIAQIERMAAGAICSNEAIHSVALGALNASRNPKLVSGQMKLAACGNINVEN